MFFNTLFLRIINVYCPNLRPFAVVLLLNVLDDNAAVLLGILAEVGDPVVLIVEATEHVEALAGGVDEGAEDDIGGRAAGQLGHLSPPDLHGSFPNIDRNLGMSWNRKEYQNWFWAGLAEN